eukprot:15476035-Alexandrium_andersonii.AAC.5
MSAHANNNSDTTGRNVHVGSHSRAAIGFECNDELVCAGCLPSARHSTCARAHNAHAFPNTALGANMCEHGEERAPHFSLIGTGTAYRPWPKAAAHLRRGDEAPMGNDGPLRGRKAFAPALPAGHSRIIRRLACCP